MYLCLSYNFVHSGSTPQVLIASEKLIGPGKYPVVEDASASESNIKSLTSQHVQYTRDVFLPVPDVVRLLKIKYPDE